MTARALCGVALASAACAPAVTATPTYPTRRARADAVLALGDASARLEAGRARTLHVSARVRAAGQVHEGRGIVAVRPPTDVRMVLIGPSGLTALDLWVSGARDRLAVPALARIERDAPPRPGRPQNFLRWWLLAPLSGRVLWVDDAGRVTLRARDGATVEVTLRGGRVRATRRTRTDVERVEADLAGCGEATWRSEVAGVEVRIVCESVSGPAPDRAFEAPP
ncbi:MAG: hypothetical protein IT374_01560 [Polyangiaceae bacterium]|nr:hypothetical protein [Polyangiaceae bacterium]